MAKPSKFYRLNLVRDLREREARRERQRRLAFLLGASCFLILALSIAYSGLTMWKMERILAHERQKVKALTQEYRKYQSSRLIVEKGDVELLSSLQGRGIFWTKKLAALATHLPENYWISHFTYKDGELRVSGHGYASSRQDQLLVLDGYMNRLRQDTTFSNVFKHVFLSRSDYTEEGGESRIAFEFQATRKPVKGGKARKAAR